MTEALIDLDEMLLELRRGPARGVLVYGQVNWKDIYYVLEACQPTPIKVGMLNPTEETIRDALKFEVALHVGSTLKPVTPVIWLYTKERRIMVTDDYMLARCGSDSFDQLYAALPPWDGQSLDSSLAKVSRAQRNLISSLALGAHSWSPHNMSPVFWETEILAFSRNTLLILGVLVLVMGLLIVESWLLALSGGLAIAAGVFLSERLKHLRRKLGEFHA